MTATAQHAGRGTAQAPSLGGGCEAPGRGYERRVDRRPTRRQGGSLPRRAP